MSQLTNPHQAVGNGQHLPCAALALLAALTSIELFPEPSPCAELIPSSYHNVEINVPSDGRCYYSCIYLHFATFSEKSKWANTLRNKAGFAVDISRQKEEDWPTAFNF